MNRNLKKNNYREVQECCSNCQFIMQGMFSQTCCGHPKNRKSLDSPKPFVEEYTVCDLWTEVWSLTQEEFDDILAGK